MRPDPDLKPLIKCGHVIRPRYLRFPTHFAYHRSTNWARHVRAALFSTHDLTTARGRSFGQKLLAVLLALSFFWLSYVAQTHIHPRPVAAVAAISKIAQAVTKSVSSPAKDNSDGAADCPLCQAVNAGGALVLPLLLAFLAAVVAVGQQRIPPDASRVARSLSWQIPQTRGPPSL